MSKFKVGQRVWSFIHNSFMWVSQINGDYGCHLASDEKLLINYSHKYEEFHQTADDMFEALGWKEVENDTFIYFIPKETDFDVVLLVEYIEIEKETNQITDVSINEPNIVKKHLAVHQKMIELGGV